MMPCSKPVFLLLFVWASAVVLLEAVSARDTSHHHSNHHDTWRSSYRTSSSTTHHSSRYSTRPDDDQLEIENEIETSNSREFRSSSTWSNSSVSKGGKCLGTIFSPSPTKCKSLISARLTPA